MPKKPLPSSPISPASAAEPGSGDPGPGTIIIAPDQAGDRLDRVLTAGIADLSRSRLKQLIEEGRVRDGDGATILNPSHRVKPGERYIVAVPPPIDDRPLPQAIDLDIRYEDDDLLVVDKPAGMVVHPAPSNVDRTLVNALLAHCGDRLPGIGGVKRPGIVHRIDKDTSGLMVVAKSAVAHARLSAAFAAHDMTRAYRAVVWGVPLPRAGTITGNIGRSSVNRKKMAVVEGRGKAAITHYRVVQGYGDVAALVECRLATGRTHQIRVHLTEKGHALVGDPVYGARPRPQRLRGLSPERAAIVAAFPRQALHAYLLGFDHPTTGQHLEFRSSDPKDIEQLIATLETF